VTLQRQRHGVVDFNLFTVVAHNKHVITKWRHCVHAGSALRRYDVCQCWSNRLHIWIHNDVSHTLSPVDKLVTETAESLFIQNKLILLTRILAIAGHLRTESSKTVSPRRRRQYSWHIDDKLKSNVKFNFRVQVIGLLSTFHSQVQYQVADDIKFINSNSRKLRHIPHMHSTPRRMRPRRNFAKMF